MLRSGTIAVGMVTLTMVLTTTLFAATPYRPRQVQHQHVGCSCGQHATPVPLVTAGRCAPCQRCCLPLIPQVLRSVDCLLKKVFCCSTCANRCSCLGGRYAPSCGCDGAVSVGPMTVEEIIVETPRSVTPTPVRMEGRYSPPHQRAAPKLRETQLKNHSVIQRTTYQKQTAGVPARLSVTMRPVQHARAVTTEIRAVTVPHNPLRD